MKTLFLEKIKPQSLTASELATTTLELDELINMPNSSPEGFYLRLGDGSKLGGLRLLVDKAQIPDLNLIASEISITPDITQYGTGKNVHNALTTIANNFSVGGVLARLNDGGELTSDLWSGYQIRHELNLINAEIGSTMHAPVQDIPELQAIDTTSLPDKVLILVEDNGQYRFDLQSGAAPVGDKIIAPTTGSGRWIKMSSTTMHDAVTVAASSSDYISLSAPGSQELNFSLAKFQDASLNVDFSEVKVLGVDIANLYQQIFNGFGFIKANGTSISYDNSTYLTGSKVDSFNGRTGIVTLIKSDIENVLTDKIGTHYHHRLYGERLGVGTDLNNLKNNPIGLYYDAFIASSANNPNYFNNANGVITMMSLDNTYGKQIAFGDDYNLYHRRISNNNFFPWHKFFHSGNSNISTENWSVKDGSTQYHAVNFGQLSLVNAKLGTLSTGFVPVWDGSKLANSAFKISSGIAQYDAQKTFSNPRDIVDKSYVDAIASGNLPKLPVDAATTANITLSGLQTIDGYTVTAGMRVLVKNQTTASQNGVYLAATGAWTRTTDLDSWDELYKAYVAVLSGAQSGSSYVCNIPASGTLGTTDVTWVLYSAPTSIIAGNGILKTGNTISAYFFNGTNGGSANTLSRSDHTHNMSQLIGVPGFGTTAGTIAEGNDSRILNGETAFGWGNHADAGYLTSIAISLAGLTDTNIASPADDDFMIYDTASTTWRNEQVQVVCLGGARTV